MPRTPRPSRSPRFARLRPLFAALALALTGCGGGGAFADTLPPPAPPSSPPAAVLGSLELELTGLTRGPVSKLAAGTAEATEPVPDVVLTVVGKDGTGATTQVEAHTDVDAEGRARLAVPGVLRGTDAAVTLELHNGVTYAGFSVLRGAELIREGPNAVRLNGPGSKTFDRGATLEDIVIDVPGVAPEVEEATGRRDPTPRSGGADAPGSHDEVRENLAALLVCDLPGTWWSSPPSSVQIASYQQQADHMRALLLELGFARVDTVDGVPTIAGALDAYHLVVVTAYNANTNVDVVPTLRSWMERRRGGLVLGSGTPSLLAMKYPAGQDILSAGGQTTTDLTPLAGLIGFRRYANASGDGFVTDPGLFRMITLGNAPVFAAASLDASTAVSAQARVIAWHTQGGVKQGMPWASAYELAGEPSATAPGTTNSANARCVWLACEPQAAAAPGTRSALAAMFKGAVLFASGALGRVDGTAAPDWSASANAKLGSAGLDAGSAREDVVLEVTLHRPEAGSDR